MRSRKHFHKVRLKDSEIMMCLWLHLFNIRMIEFIFQISLSVSHEQTGAKMINTIKTVHLSTVPDGAVFQGGIMKSLSVEADEMQ